MSDLTITAKDFTEEKRAANVVTEKRKQLEKLVDKIFLLPRGPQRWRAAVDLGIALDMNDKSPEVNPYGLSAGAEYVGVKADVAQRRKYMKNKFGTSEDVNSDLRAQFEWPAFVPQMIRMVDPEAFEKDNIPAMRKEFSDFVLSEVY